AEAAGRSVGARLPGGGGPRRKTIRADRAGGQRLPYPERVRHPAVPRYVPRDGPGHVPDRLYTDVARGESAGPPPALRDVAGDAHPPPPNRNWAVPGTESQLAGGRPARARPRRE